MIVILAACSSAPPKDEGAPAKRSGPPSAATQDAPAPADARHRLVAFGDSLTAGFGVETGFSYPDFLQKLIDGKHYPWRVINAGVSGDTSSDGLARLPAVLDYKPEIVILELGANDGLRGIPVDATRANLEQMIQDLQRGGAKVVLAGMTLPPNYGPEYIKPFEKIFTGLAATYKLPLIPFLLEGVGGNSKLMQADGLHANVEGNRRVAGNVMKVVEPLLR
mgnify:FL=1